MAEARGQLTTGKTLAWTSAVTGGVAALLGGLAILSPFGLFPVVTSMLLIFLCGSVGVTVIIGSTSWRLLRATKRWERWLALFALLLGCGQIALIVFIVHYELSSGVRFGR